MSFQNKSVSLRKRMGKLFSFCRNRSIEFQVVLGKPSFGKIRSSTSFSSSDDSSITNLSSNLSSGSSFAESHDDKSTASHSGSSVVDTDSTGILAGDDVSIDAIVTTVESKPVSTMTQKLVKLDSCVPHHDTAAAAGKEIVVWDPTLSVTGIRFVMDPFVTVLSRRVFKVDSCSQAMVVYRPAVSVARIVFSAVLDQAKPQFAALVLAAASLSNAASVAQEPESVQSTAPVQGSSSIVKPVVTATDAEEGCKIETLASTKSTEWSKRSVTDVFSKKKKIRGINLNKVSRREVAIKKVEEYFQEFDRICEESPMMSTGEAQVSTFCELDEIERTQLQTVEVLEQDEADDFDYEAFMAKQKAMSRDDLMKMTTFSIFKDRWVGWSIFYEGYDVYGIRGIGFKKEARAAVAKIEEPAFKVEGAATDDKKKRAHKKKGANKKKGGKKNHRGRR